ncbi:MAG: hypothetical protein LC676_10910 [Loktanella sp.]|nr:hypothetical protein [Loktanella sp.]
MTPNERARLLSEILTGALHAIAAVLTAIAILFIYHFLGLIATAALTRIGLL